jgi:hypothetical protein
MCRACGHVLEEVVAVKYTFENADDVRTQFGKFPTFESVFLPVEEPLPEGTLVGLRLILPAPWGEMTIPSRVTAMARTPSTPATPYRLQMNLLQVDREKQARLKAVIAGEVPPLAARAAPPAPPTVVPAVIGIDEVLGTIPEAAPARKGEPLEGAARVGTDAASPRPAPREDAEVDLDLDELLRPLQRAWWPPAPAGLSESAEPPVPARERPPEHVARLLTDFVMHLTRAVVKTSYYEPDHLAAMQAKVGLYDIFRMLIADSHEVTFLNETTESRRTMMVQGLFDEPAELDRVMLKGQAALFGHKLATYMEAKGLLSISFKQSLDHGEFLRFVDLLATPAHTAGNAASDFSVALAAQKVRNISVVFKSDLLTKRKLSRRVALALTRLKKDLSMLTLHEGLGPDELRSVRHQVFRDVIRPLRTEHLTRELLLNCDLVAAEVTDLSQEEIEGLVEEAVTPEILPELLGRFTQDAVEALQAKDLRATELLRITRSLALRLAPAQRDLKESVFRQLLDQGVLILDEMPPSLQGKVAVEQKTDRFLKHWRTFLQSFDDAATPGVYQKHLDMFLVILPELLSRHDLDVASKIALLIAKHRVVREGFPTRASMAGVWLTGLGTSRVATEIADQLMSTDKVRREGVLTLCGILGDGAVPILFKALCDCPTRSIRLELCELLVSLKEQTSRFLAAELEKKNIPWYFQRNLLNLMGRVGDDSNLPLVGHFLSDKHPRLRLEALLSVCALDPAGAERMLVWGLADPDLDIRGVSVRQLAQRRSTAPELFDHFRDVLWAADGVDEENARQVCGLLASYQAGEGHDEAVDLLLDVLQEDQKKGFWSRLSTPQQAQAMKVLACQTLGRLRAKRAVGLLSGLAEGRNKALRQAALQALRFIQQSERV